MRRFSTTLTLTCLVLPALPCAAQSIGDHSRYQRPGTDYGDDVLHEGGSEVFDQMTNGGIPDEPAMAAALSGARPISNVPFLDLGSRGGYIANHGVITRLSEVREIPADQSSGEPIVWLIGVPARPDFNLGESGPYVFDPNIFDSMGDGALPDDQSAGGREGEPDVWLIGVPARRDIDLGQSGPYVFDRSIFDAMGDGALPDDQSAGGREGDANVWLIGVPARRDIDLGQSGPYVFDPSIFDAMGDGELPDDQSAGGREGDANVWLIGVPARRDIDLGQSGPYVFDPSIFDAMGEGELPDDQSSGDASDDSEPFVSYYEDDAPEVDVPDAPGGHGQHASGYFQPAAHPDMNADGGVNAADLVSLILNWGACDAGQACAGDLDQDGFVDATDLAILLFNWK